MANGLNRAFHLCFGVLMLALLGGTVVAWRYNGIAAMAVALLLCAVGVAVVVFAAPAVDRMSARRFRMVFAALAAVLLVLLAVLGCLMDEVMIMDWEYVYRTLPDFLDNFRLDSYDGYYMVCNNNLGLALLLTAFYKPLELFGIAPGTDAGNTAGILFNAVMIFLAVMLACRLAWLVLRRQSAPLLLLVLALCFAPLYLWAPCFYSDTLCMPFLMGSLCTYQRWRQGGGVRWMVATGLLIFLGFAVKGSVVVLLPAAAIVALLERGANRQTFKAILVMAAVFLVLLAGYKGWQRGWLDWEKSDAFCYPTELWFCYGSHNLGDYSQKDVDDCNALETVAQRREMLRQRIAENYAARGLGGNLSFIARKAVRTWGDGKYDADEFLCTQLHTNWTAQLIIPGQPGFMPLTYYCQAWQYALLLLCGIGALLAARQSGQDGLAFARMSLWGVMVFLSFWETKPRYAFHFSPVLLLCAAGTLYALAGLVQRRRAEQREPALVG